MKKWVTSTAIPWLRWRMFRTGIPSEAPLVVHERTFTWANLITLVRLLGLPFFAYLALARHAWFASFVVFGTLAFLDSVDGYIARRYNQATRIGAMLDHVTDRATIFVMALALLALDLLPLVLVGLIVVRDVLLFVIVTVLGQFGRPLPTGRVPITRTGKLATMILLVSLPLLLLRHSRFPGGGGLYWAGLTLTCTGLILYYVAFFQYLRAGMVRRPPGDAGRDSRPSGDALRHG
jgi:cardiolipin synthase